MSEQDKRPVYMGNFERFKKEVSVKNDDILAKVEALGKMSMFNAIIAGLALGIAIMALAI
jgi:hypothetical protein